ncbi:hypothetical protein PFLUV_G00138140 [Perca fluviatilis]|uniref:Uncharacterized protein n=1 Tax=Perca fluviatilis TaxID=8168 RepID=A0A6A5F4V9_PERFL|nr:hypothetical protein PFLUV_G00138140 [Perca fluviatilis]
MNDGNGNELCFVRVKYVLFANVLKPRHTDILAQPPNCIYPNVCRWKGILAIGLFLGKRSKYYVSLLNYPDNVFHNGNVIYNLKTVIPRPR